MNCRVAASSVSLSFWAVIFLVVGFGVYLCAIFLSILRLVFLHPDALRDAIEVLLWYSGVPTTAGVLLFVIDLGFLLPKNGGQLVESSLAGRSGTV